MLILSRKQFEKVRIDGPCTITVCRLRGDAVRLGIEAPKHVRILRTELSTKAESSQ